MYIRWITVILMLIPCRSTGFAQHPAPVHNFSYNVLEFGVQGDSTLHTRGIQKAIDTAAENDGGTIYFPAGDYLSGSLRMRSNITLYLENGCTIWGSSDIDDFIPVEPERPQFDARHERNFIHGENLENIAIRGQGVIDGNGTAFYPEGWNTGSEGDIRKMMLDENGYSSRPGVYIKFVNCRNIVFEDVTFRYSPTWMLHLSNCDDVQIEGVSIHQGIFENDGPNTDGMWLSGSRMRISNCELITGDDSICIYGDAEDITITNCILTSDQSAFVIGPGELTRGITITNCTIREAGSCLSIRGKRGRLLDGVVVSNIVYTLDRQKGGNLLFMRVAPIELRPALAHYVKQWGTSDRPPEGPPAILRNIRFSNITAECDGAIFMDGDQEQDIEDVSFDNIRILMRGGVNKSGSADPSHPFHVFGHTQAPYGIFCRYVKDINFSNVRFLWNTPEQSEWGSPLRIHHGKNIGIDGFSGRQALGSTRPAIWLRDVEGAFVRNCRAPEGTGTFLRVSEETTNVTVMSNDLDQAAQALDIQQSVEASEVFLSGNRLPD